MKKILLYGLGGVVLLIAAFLIYELNLQPKKARRPQQLIRVRDLTSTFPTASHR